MGDGGVHFSYPFRNLVVGPEHSWTSYGGLIAGYNNTVTGAYSSVSGGYDNTASGGYSSVSGGNSNTASTIYSYAP